MKYQNVVKAFFVQRKNRFVATVLLENREVEVHVKNTGRCKELLVSGSLVYLTRQSSPQRKTEYDLIAVEKKLSDRISVLINMDSQAPNALVGEWLPISGLFSESAIIRSEVNFASSRFDFYVEDQERKAFLEVKGVTLEENRRTFFPDAPTVRGRKHLLELVKAKEAGYESYVIFVIQMENPRSFSPNDRTDPAFSDALKFAFKSGVNVIALSCKVQPDYIRIADYVPLDLLRKSCDIIH